VRAFITGGHGFVGGWLRAHLEAAGDDIVAPGVELDVRDGPALCAAVEQARPDAIYHLAALSHVGDSWDAPEETFVVNAVGTLHLLEAARFLGRSAGVMPRVLLVCSAEVYGPVRPEQLPVTEDTPLRPVTPYAVSKVSAEYLGLQMYLAHGLPVVRVRAFNHVGPGQAPSFVVSSLARQIAVIERDGGRQLRVGNLTPRRDFTDVRDVVRAYRLLVERGVPGEVYNVCSVKDVGIEELARRLLRRAGLALELSIDPALERPVEVPVMRGDPSRLRAATGWTPATDLDETLDAVLDYWRSELARSPA
jgi:GDP-4-dehydro-6-deoxy-D-mannose reductase